MRGSWSSALLPWLGIALLAVLALGLRSYELGAPSLWADEANGLRRAGLALTEMLSTLAREDNHPPLYYLLLKPWLVVAGTTEAALRSFSVFWGLAAIPLAALAGQKVAGRPGAWVAALLASTAPALVIFAQEGRPYTLLAFLGLADFLLLRQALVSGRWRDWTGYTLITAASLYTHNLAFVWLVWQAVVVVVAGRRGRIGRFALAQSVAYVLYLPWAAILIAQFGALAAGGAWLESPSLGRLLFTVASFLGGASYHREGDLRPAVGLTHLYLLLGPLLLVYGGARRLPPRQHWPLLAFTVLPIVCLFAIAQAVPVYVDRALLLSVFGVLVLAAAAFRSGLPRPSMVLLGAALGVTLVLHVTSLLAYYQQPRDNYRALAADLAVAARPGETVLFLPGFGRVAFQYYWDRTPHSSAVRLADMDGGTSLDVAALLGNGRLWIVRVAAPPPPEAMDVHNQLTRAGFYRVGIRGYPDALLTLELYAADSSDTGGLSWRESLHH